MKISDIYDHILFRFSQNDKFFRLKLQKTHKNTFYVQ